ncbi:MAG: ABC transporter ATP-binding protein [Pseudomonadota bacterium]
MIAEAEETPRLEARSVSYVSNTGGYLLEDVSFSIAAGEIIALVGPNGAGKTTLIRIMAGLKGASEGKMLLDGIAIDRIGFAERSKQIAYVGQSDDADGRLSVAQYISLGLLPHQRLFAGDLSDTLPAEALERVGLSRLANRRMDQISGGERQKAKIARAMCQRPKLLVLDEPTNHLDPHARGELLGLVAGMNITVVAALHDLTMVEAFAHKTAIIENGRLLAFGPSQDVLSSAQVRNVFGVDMHRLAHPHEDRFMPTLDIPLSKAKPVKKILLNLTRPTDRRDTS